MTAYSDEGDEILLALEESKRFSDWMYSEVKPWLAGSILEIGSGRGTYSKKIIADHPRSKIILSDIDPTYLKQLASRFHGEKIKVMKIDLSKRFNAPKVDCIVALNVLEHIENDEQALKNIYQILNPKGRFIMLVPAHTQLYGSIDKAAGHYRRYDHTSLILKASKAEFRIKSVWYFNFLSIFAWYLNCKILRRKTVSTKAMRIFDVIIPVLKPFERIILRKRIGLSLIAVLEKQ